MPFPCYWEQCSNKDGCTALSLVGSRVLWVCPGVVQLGHMVVLVLVLTFWEIPTLISVVVVPVCIPTDSEDMFPFLHNLTNICCNLTFSYYPFWLGWETQSGSIYLCVYSRCMHTTAHAWRSENNLPEPVLSLYNLWSRGLNLVLQVLQQAPFTTRPSHRSSELFELHFPVS